MPWWRSASGSSGRGRRPGPRTPPAAPGLLPGEQPAAVGPLARARWIAGEVAAGVGLGPAPGPRCRRPRPSAAGCAPAAPACRTRSSVGASRKMPFWLTRAGAAGAVVLLLEDQPLQQRSRRARRTLGPRDHRPAAPRRAALPLRVQLEALGGVAPRAAARGARWPPATRAPRARNALLALGVARFTRSPRPACFMDFASIPASELPASSALWACARWCRPNDGVHAVSRRPIRSSAWLTAFLVSARPKRGIAGDPVGELERRRASSSSRGTTRLTMPIS